MKIITNNFKPVVPVVYPRNANCQVCGSVIELTTAADVKQVQIPVIKTSKAETQKFTTGPGFICPACSGLNILG